MELSLPFISMPAIVALVLKAVVYLYTRLCGISRNIETRLYLLFLCSLAIQNIAEIVLLYLLNIKNEMPRFEVKLFYASLIAAIAFLCHLAAVLAFDRQRQIRRIAPFMVYCWGIALEILLFSPHLLIADFEVLDYGIGRSVTRVPGPLYFLFELYAIGGFAGVIAMSLYGSKKQSSARRRSKNRVLLLAVIPMLALVVSVLVLLHFRVKLFNASLTFPIAVTYFLFVTAYGIHSRRFLDPTPSGQEVIAALRAQLEKLHEEKHANNQDGQSMRRETAIEISMERTLDEQVAALEMKIISQALDLSDGNQSKAAILLGIRPNTLHYKIERYGLCRRKPRR